MTKLTLVKNKITQAQKYLKILKGFKKYRLDQIENNILVSGSLERYLYLTIQSAIDLCEAYIGVSGLRKPTSLKENFEIVHEEKIITQKLMEKLQNMTGLRNILSHQYFKIDLKKLHQFVQKDLKDIDAFLKAIEKKI